MNLGDIQAINDRSSYVISESLEVTILNFIPVCIVILLCLFKIFSVLGIKSALLITISLITYVTITLKMAIFRNNIRKRHNTSKNNVVSFGYDRLSNKESIDSFGTHEKESGGYFRLLKNLYFCVWRSQEVFCL